MATSTIPNLWPEIKVNVITPYAILQAQASQLSQSTQGLLRAEIIARTYDNSESYLFDIIAPVLNNYRQTLLRFTQLTDNAYPVVVQSSVSQPENLRPAGKRFFAEKAFAKISEELNPTPIFTDTDFIKRVGEILQSPQAQAIIYSLIARSNEQGNSKDRSYAELLGIASDTE